MFQSSGLPCSTGTVAALVGWPFKAKKSPNYIVIRHGLCLAADSQGFEHVEIDRSDAVSNNKSRTLPPRIANDTAPSWCLTASAFGRTVTICGTSLGMPGTTPLAR